MVQKGVRSRLKLVLELGNVEKSSPQGTGFEGMKGGVIESSLQPGTVRSY